MIRIARLETSKDATLLLAIGGFLHGAGPETRILVTVALGKNIPGQKKTKQKQRCIPRKQIKMRFRPPLPNISTSSSRKKAIWGPQKPSPGNAGKFREIQGFLSKAIVMPRKGQSREFRETRSGDPEWEFWDDFPGRMRMAKVYMLGTGEV